MTHTVMAELGPRADRMSRKWLDYAAAHPATSVAIGVVALCTGEPPTREEIAVLVSMAVDAYPELGRHPVPEPARSAGAPGTPFRLDQQIFEVEAESGSGQAGLRAVLERLTAEPLPAALWGVWLVHGYAAGEFAVVLRGHHALFDGLLLTDIIACALGAEPRRRSGAAAGSAPRRADPATALREARALFRDRGRAAQPVPPSVKLTGRVRYAWDGVSVERMRAAAAAHRATSNDVYLAALAGALRVWAPDPRWLAGGRPVRVQVPIGYPHEAGRLGVRATAAWVRLPCEVDDPAERTALVKVQTDRLRASLRDPHTGSLTRLVSKLLGRFDLDLQYHPGWMSLLVSHVPGPAATPAIAGRTVTAGVPLMFLPARQYLATAMCDFAGMAQLCVVADQAVPDVDELARQWVHQVDLLGGHR
ncbi:WS/DGAT domain-containing protein [Kitasatospora sp. NBC_00315]|uniref:WS/DGAT domain-containing protein n=1 Tax=Kitasatospora sp. NBC_00315 TaxID=2975963 RepID=UPI00325254A4